MPEPLTFDQRRQLALDCEPVAKRNALRIAAERYEDAPRAYVELLARQIEEALIHDFDLLDLSTIAEWSADQQVDAGAELDLERSRGL